MGLRTRTGRGVRVLWGWRTELDVGRCAAGCGWELSVWCVCWGGWGRELDIGCMCCGAEDEDTWVCTCCSFRRAWLESSMRGI